MAFRRVTKRDANETFGRADNRPNCVETLRAEFHGIELGFPGDIVFFWRARPFRRLASPGCFQTCARLIAKFHCAYYPVSHLRGSLPFASHMFVGDAMLIDADIPARLELSANARGRFCDVVLGAGSVSDKKKLI